MTTRPNALVSLPLGPPFSITAKMRHFFLNGPLGVGAALSS